MALRAAIRSLLARERAPFPQRPHPLPSALYNNAGAGACTKYCLMALRPASGPPSPDPRLFALAPPSNRPPMHGNASPESSSTKEEPSVPPKKRAPILTKHSPQTASPPQKTKRPCRGPARPEKSSCYDSRQGPGQKVLEGRERSRPGAARRAVPVTTKEVTGIESWLGGEPFPRKGCPPPKELHRPA